MGELTDGTHSIVENTVGAIGGLGDARRGGAVIRLLRDALDELESNYDADGKKQPFAEVSLATSEPRKLETN